MGLEGFGERLKTAIKDSKYSQKEISEKIRINQDTITNYVKEKFFPKADSLYDICNLLKVSADWLLFGEKKEEKTSTVSDLIKLSDMEFEMIKHFRELNERDKREVNAYIKLKLDLEMRAATPRSSISNSGKIGEEEAATSEIA